MSAWHQRQAQAHATLALAAMWSGHPDAYDPGWTEVTR